MSYFRINIFLSIKNFFKSFFQLSNDLKQDNHIRKFILKNTNKRNLTLTSQCRTSLMYILKYLKKKFPKKNEIIYCAYNFPEMVHISRNLGLKINFCDLNYQTGFFDLTMLKRQISNKTLAVVMTNMFNSYEESIKLKKICKKKIFVIEDNAIYFDNYKSHKGKKIRSGSIGDFSIYSFNIMKNISALYGGAVASNIIDFHNYLEQQLTDLKNFNKIIYFRQALIFFILKIMSINLLYKYFFLNIVKVAHQKNKKFLLRIFYPSLKFKIIKFPEYYFTNITAFSKKLIFNQLIEEEKRKDIHNKRKNKNLYYDKKIKKLKNNYINTIKISDLNYQNFTDYPILVKRKNQLNNFLLNKGIETRFFHYKNCEKIFSKSRKILCPNAERYEKEIICLPNHKKITLEYINYVVQMITEFYSDKKN